MFKVFEGKKTYIIVILGVLILGTKLVYGDISLIEFVSSPDFVALLGLLGIGTLRHGVSKK